jgi:uncharacterized membrane protein
MDSEAMNQMIEQCSAMMRGMQHMMNGTGDMSAMPGPLAASTAMAGMTSSAATPSWLVPIAVVAAALFVGSVAVAAVQRRRRGTTPSASSTSAEFELARRYARGEVNPDEYAQIRADLGIAPQ